MADLAHLLNLPANFYEQSICKLLEKDSGETGISHFERCSMIACTARSGSSLLQVCLEHYGLDAQEWLNPKGAIKVAVDAGEASTLTQYGDYLARTAKNGRFDVKGTLSTLAFLFQIREVPERNDRWRFVFLKRRNVVQQAISGRIAVRTGQWTKTMPKQAEVTDADYSFDEIAKGVTSVIQQNANLEKAFAVLGIEPFRVHYEDFVQDITKNTWEVAKYVGVDVPAEPIEIKPRLEQQFSDINARWEVRFREEMDATLRAR